jgi:dihydroorotate dehydrogenase (fumarate)
MPPFGRAQAEHDGCNHRLARHFMNLATQYLGLWLPHPFIPGASPLADDLDKVLRLEDAGAPAIVMPSLFEEDIVRYDAHPDRYLEQVLRIKRRVLVPLIASLNGTTPDTWLRYANMFEQAGADAIELNFYHVPTDPDENSGSIERRVIDIVAVLRESIGIPLAVKLSPFYTSLPNLAAHLDRLGVAGLVLFNRFYQPDIDPDRREVSLRLNLSDSSELALRLRWIAILSGRVKASLVLTGGVHEPLDAVKAVMAGADGVQIVSALLQHGPRYLTHIRTEFERWGDEHGYASIGAMRGCLSLARCPNPESLDRGNYIKQLRTPLAPSYH